MQQTFHNTTHDWLVEQQHALTSSTPQTLSPSLLHIHALSLLFALCLSLLSFSLLLCEFSGKETTKTKKKQCLLLKDNHHQHQQPPSATGGGGVGVGAYKKPGVAAAGATIHIPLSGNKAGTNGTGAVVVPPEVNRTTVWQQINKDGISEQLIIPVTVKVRQINGNQ